nr:MAG TPA: excisionase [Caudoviricetes sp.]
MPREHESFRDQLQSLREQFDGQEVLTMDQSCKLLGLDRDALVNDKAFPAKKVGKKYIIPIVPLARWMSTW